MHRPSNRQRSVRTVRGQLLNHTILIEDQWLACECKREGFRSFERQRLAGAVADRDICLRLGKNALDCREVELEFTAALALYADGEIPTGDDRIDHETIPGIIVKEACYDAVLQIQFLTRQQSAELGRINI